MQAEQQHVRIRLKPGCSCTLMPLSPVGMSSLTQREGTGSLETAAQTR